MIILIGMPGSGKSTVGRQLARRLGVSFTDTDQRIEQRLGCSIRAFFEQEGEERFRSLEERVLEEVVADRSVGVFATGGGAVLRQANRSRMRQSGRVVYLHALADDIFRRLRKDGTRPLLQTADPLQRLRDLYAQRDPLYRETAHYVIETGRPSVATLVNMVMMQLELAGDADSGAASPYS